MMVSLWVERRQCNFDDTLGIAPPEANAYAVADREGVEGSKEVVLTPDRIAVEADDLGPLRGVGEVDFEALPLVGGVPVSV